MTYSYSQYPTSTQVLGLRIFLTQPGRSLNAGYSWPGGFPPRSKWTYGEVFHPAVVPQPPFNNNKANSFSLAVKKKTPKTKNKNQRILTISTNRTNSCISENRSMVFPTGVNLFTGNIFHLRFTCSFHLSRLNKNLLFSQSKFSHSRIFSTFQAIE